MFSSFHFVLCLANRRSERAWPNERVSAVDTWEDEKRGDNGSGKVQEEKGAREAEMKEKVEEMGRVDGRTELERRGWNVWCLHLFAVPSLLSPFLLLYHPSSSSFIYLHCHSSSPFFITFSVFPLICSPRFTRLLQLRTFRSLSLCFESLNFLV